MSIDQATIGKTSQSSLQDHYSSSMQPNYKKHGQSTTSYHSAYTGMVSLDPSNQDSKKYGDLVPSSYNQKFMPAFNNDFEQRTNESYDEMFEQAELQATKRSLDSFSQLKKRDDQDTI